MPLLFRASLVEHWRVFAQYPDHTSLCTHTLAIHICEPTYNFNNEVTGKICYIRPMAGYVATIRAPPID